MFAYAKNYIDNLLLKKQNRLIAREGVRIENSNISVVLNQYKIEFMNIGLNPATPSGIVGCMYITSLFDTGSHYYNVTDSSKFNQFLFDLGLLATFNQGSSYMQGFDFHCIVSQSSNNSDLVGQNIRIRNENSMREIVYGYYNSNTNSWEKVDEVDYNSGDVFAAIQATKMNYYEDRV